MGFEVCETILTETLCRTSYRENLLKYMFPFPSCKTQREVYLAYNLQPVGILTTTGSTSNFLHSVDYT